MRALALEAASRDIGGIADDHVHAAGEPILRQGIEQIALPDRDPILHRKALGVTAGERDRAVGQVRPPDTGRRDFGRDRQSEIAGAAAHVDHRLAGRILAQDRDGACPEQLGFLPWHEDIGRELQLDIHEALHARPVPAHRIDCLARHRDSFRRWTAVTHGTLLRRE